MYVFVCDFVLSCFSHVRLCVTPWTVGFQTPLSMEFSRQEYWSGLPCPPPTYVCVCMCVCVCLCVSYFLQSIHLLKDTAFFHVFAIVNIAAVNIGLYMSFPISVLFFFFRQVTRRGICASYSSFIFSFLSDFCAVFCSG